MDRMKKHISEESHDVGQAVYGVWAEIRDVWGCRVDDM